MLKNGDVPDRSVAVLADHLARVARDGSLGGLVGQTIAPEALTATVPHPVYVLRGDRLRRGAGIDEPEAAGWRYLVGRADEVVAIAETMIDSNGDHKPGSVATGPFVEATVRAVRLANERLQGASEEFTIAALDIPSLHARVLQLTSSGGPSGDLFLPVGNVTTLDPERFYSRAEMRAALTELAVSWAGDEPVGG
jgi:hypothetical protein